MSEHQLPDNLAEWPEDPFQLFGINHTIQPRDLRRVYTRLLRLYKPERKPEHFRRIREAYEILERYAAWNALQAESLPSEIESLPGCEPKTAAGSDPAFPPSIVQSESPEINGQESWLQALAGDFAPAYRGLVQLTESPVATPTCYLRLYWLLMIRPDLDEHRTPCDWLVAGLAACDDPSRLLGQYREELADASREALHARFESLLEKVRGNLFQELLRLRWKALIGLQRWDLVLVDLDRFADQVCREDEIAWLELLFSLASRCFPFELTSRKSLFRTCEERIRALGHLALKHSELFDRLELLTQLAHSAIAGIPRPVFHVVVCFVADATEDLPKVAQAFLDVVSNSPEAGMEILDQTARISPPFYWEFGRALRWLCWQTSEKSVAPYTEELVQTLAGAVVDQVLNLPSYSAARRLILNFCCNEGLAPHHVGQFLQAPPLAPNHLSEMIDRDFSLHWTYQAYCLVWSQ